MGNGPNLSLTPPHWFEFPSFGMNTIFMLEGWKPTYYVAVDSRVMREFSEAINEKFGEIPKFLPTPNLDKWQGPNIYRFYHRPGLLWPWGALPLWPSGLMTEQGITYGNVMHVAMQIAYYMGFRKMLIIGMEHQKFKAQEHFWGVDHATSANAPIDEWMAGYKTIREGMGVEMLNISPYTHVPEDILPTDDWMKYATKRLL